jgi:hypothetical protein
MLRSDEITVPSEPVKPRGIIHGTRRLAFGIAS